MRMSTAKSSGESETTPGPGDGAASLQDSDDNSAAAMSASSINLPLIVSLPILLVVVTAVIILIMILMWCLYRKKKKKSGYKSVPTECVDTPPQKPGIKKLNNKPKVHLSDPPVPGVTTQFIEAAQLGPVDGAGLGSRYPFIKSSKSSASEKEKKPRKLSSRRARPLGVVARRAQSTDRSSDGSEDGYSSPRRLFARGTAWGSSATTPAETPSPEHRLPRAISGPSALIEQRSESLPELGLCLVFNEKEAQLTVKVERATKLPCRPNGNAVDSYVRLYFVPKLAEMPQRKTAKTEIVRGNCEPVFDQAMQYEAMTMAELINSVLHVEVLDIPDSTGFGKHKVLGRSDLPLVQVQFIAGEAPLSLPLSPPIMREDLGTILVSLTYTPESKKLSVILLRAKDLNKGESHTTDALAKISVTLSGDKVLGKLKTKKKAQSCSPIFNETLSCTVEPTQIKNAAISIVILNDNRSARSRDLGRVLLCNQCTGEEYRHWSDVMATPGKPISEWHDLR